MPKRQIAQHDRRSKLDLEFLVIALLDKGINTPYRLQESAGLSTGATIPVLRRLEGRKFVTRTKPGERRRVEFRVTSQGRHALDVGWSVLFAAEPPSDFDEALRVAALATLCGASARDVSKYLKRAASAKAELLKEDPAALLDKAFRTEKDGGLYKAMRFSLQFARLQSGIGVLLDLASRFDRRSK